MRPTVSYAHSLTTEYPLVKKRFRFPPKTSPYYSTNINSLQPLLALTPTWNVTQVNAPLRRTIYS